MQSAREVGCGGLALLCQKRSLSSCGKEQFQKLGEKKKKRAGWNFGIEAGWREGSFIEEDLLKSQEQRQRPTGERK